MQKPLFLPAPRDAEPNEGRKILPVQRRTGEPPTAPLSPGIAGPVGLAGRERTVLAEGQGGGPATCESRAQPGECGLKRRYTAPSASCPQQSSPLTQHPAVPSAEPTRTLTGCTYTTVLCPVLTAPLATGLWRWAQSLVPLGIHMP